MTHEGDGQRSFYMHNTFVLCYGSFAFFFSFLFFSPHFQFEILLFFMADLCKLRIQGSHSVQLN